MATLGAETSPGTCPFLQKVRISAGGGVGGGGHDTDIDDDWAKRQYGAVHGSDGILPLDGDGDGFHQLEQRRYGQRVPDNPPWANIGSGEGRHNEAMTSRQG
jgi:hypothetical protein